MNRGCTMNWRAANDPIIMPALLALGRMLKGA